MIRFIFTLAATILFGGIFLQSGCSTKDLMPEEKTSYVISVFHIVKYPGNERAEEMEIPMETFDGHTLWVNKHSYFGSADFSEVKLLPIEGKPDFVNLQLKLSRHGRQRWAQLVGSFRDDYVALTIDGKHYTSFKLPARLTEKSPDNDWETMGAEIDIDTAQNILRTTPGNYLYFNPSPIALW